MGIRWSIPITSHAITLVSIGFEDHQPGGNDGFEQGLESMRFFLRGDTDEPTCQDHLDRFLRPNARLIVVFVTDEDDCSHRFDRRPPGMDATFCYVEDGGIPKIPIEDYVSFLQTLKPNPDDLAVAVIGGAQFYPLTLSIPGKSPFPVTEPSMPLLEKSASSSCPGGGDCTAGTVCSLPLMNRE